MKRPRTVNQLRRIEHYCYLRWQKAVTREAELCWINMHVKVGDLLWRQ